MIPESNATLTRPFSRGFLYGCYWGAAKPHLFRTGINTQVGFYPDNALGTGGNVRLRRLSSQSDTYQWPPLAEPTRRKRPCILSLLICLNTARFDMPNTKPSCSVVMDESSLISVSILFSVFGELFGELFGEAWPFSELSPANSDSAADLR